MQTYIILLRGINVTGHNIIKMADLRLLLTAMGLEQVTTYIQSGNIIFRSATPRGVDDEAAIAQTIFEHYGYTVQVMLLSKIELMQIFNSNPFLERPDIDIKKLAVAVMKTPPDPQDEVELQAFLANYDEEFQIKGKWMYLYYPNGIGRSKMTTGLLEKKLKTATTTRNWRTISKLISMSEEL